MVLIILSLAWVLGVWLGSLLAPSPIWLLAATIPLFFVLMRRWRGKAVVGSLAILLLIGGALFFQSGNTVIDQDHVGFYVGSGTHTFEGTISRPPEAKEKTQSLRLADVSITVDGTNRVLTGRRSGLCSSLPRIPLR